MNSDSRAENASIPEAHFGPTALAESAPPPEARRTDELRPGIRRTKSAPRSTMPPKVRRLARICLAALLASCLCIPATGCADATGTLTALKSVADRVLPMPQRTVWAKCPQPESYIGSYDDASGAYANYVYDIDAADENGTTLRVAIVSFGGKAKGEGWLQIDAKGGSGIYYHAVDEGDVPQAARDAVE